MEDKAKQQKPTTNWKKKGLGWIPDFPDLRDYMLDNENITKDGRLKREEVTGALEDFATTFIQALNTLKKSNLESTLIPNIREELGSQIEEIEKQVFGDIRFTPVKLHKLLRACAEKPETQKQIYQSLRSKQIFELKKYLSILVLKGKFGNLDNFGEPKEIAEWLRKDEFDDKTKELVKQFQQWYRITDDGIVGLETYTALNKCLAKKSEEDQPHLPKVKLVSVPSLIPTKTFEKIREILKIYAGEQIWKEYKDKKYSVIERVKIIFEQKFLTEIEVQKEHTFQESCQLKLDWRETIKEDDYKNAIDEVFKSQFSDLSKFIELLQNEYYLIEPLVSVILKMMSPLAASKSEPLEDVAVQGWEAFKKILQNKNQSATSNISSNINNNLTRRTLNDDNIEELAQQAVHKVISFIGLAIKSIVADKNSEDSQRTLLFYFLLKKCLNSLDSSLTQEKQAKIAQSPDPNIFDKQELMEIEEQLKDVNNEDLELFPTFKLQIPMSNSFLKKIKDSPDANITTPYFHLPGVVDLSFWCSKVEDQGSLNSCAAFAGIALLEYFANRSAVDYQDASALFLYKVARNKMNVTGDVGASIRETMKAMALFGIPPEETWPYEEDKVDEEPPPFCYSYAHNYRALKYFRLDYASIPRESLLFQIKAVLAAGFPCMFGLTIYTSAYETSNTEKGYIPLPDAQKDKVVGGHAVVAVGYDDYKNIESADRQQQSTGAFLIRNSWGSGWGKNGYGWLPYDYVLYGLTAAWWSLLKSEWFEEGNFGLGARSGDPPGTETKGKS